MSDELIQVPYGEASVAARVEWPESWGAPSTPKITVTSDDGTALVAETSATQKASTVLEAAITAGASSITLAVASAQHYTGGDRILVASSAAGPAELLVVRNVTAVDADTDTVYLKDYARYSHTNGTAVTAQFSTYTLDVHTTTTYTHGLKFVLIWDHGTAVAPIRQYCQIVKRQAIVGDLDALMQDRHPDLWRAFGDHWAAFEKATYSRARLAFAAKGRDFDRLVSVKGAPTEYLLSVARFLMADSGGAEWDRDREQAKEDAIYLLDGYCSTAYWTDDDEDDTRDEESGEVESSREPPFSRGDLF